MPGLPTQVEVFYSYAHEDEASRTTLEKHLSLLRRQGVISAWHDRHIVPGADWAQAIDEHLERASIILLLISADFLASDYCYGVEMKRALERHQAKQARVIPILLRPVEWHGAPIAHLQALPTNAKAITTWGNQDEAFADVATGIRRAVEDLSLLQVSAPRAALPLVWNIPYPRNAFFIGREALLTQLRQHLQAGQATARSQPQAISGLGGIGKTQLAVEYAYRFHQDYQVVLWARAESQEALTSSYVAITSLLKLPGQEAQEQDSTVQTVKTWLQTHSGWLLILDNADDLALVPAFLPPTLGGHLLLTTRAQAMGRLANRIEVETFSPEDGALFLLRRAALLAPDAELSQASARNQELAWQISQELGGLPLALDQAGAYLEETGSSLADYLQLYQQHRTGLLAQRRGLVADHPDPVATTWSLTFARVEAKNPAAADLLRLCAYLAPDAIAEEIITRGAAHLGPQLAPVAADRLLFGQATEVLRAYSLIGRDPGMHTLSVHRLVQAVVRDAMSAENAKQWMVWTVNTVNAAFPPAAEFDNWSMCERCLPHALCCAQWIEQAHINSLEAVHLLNEAGYYVTERGRYGEAELLYRQGLAVCERQLGTEDLGTAYILTNLGYLCIRQGKYAEAEPLLLRALAIQERQLGAEHSTTANTLENLAYLSKKQGKYAEAEPFYQRVFALREKQWGVHHPSTATSLNNLALLYEEQGEDGKAESLLQRALKIFEQQQEPEQPNTAACLNNLGQLYMAQGRYEEAEPLLQRALALFEHYLGPKHPDTAAGLNNLGHLYMAQSKYEQVELLFLRALAICEQTLGPRHPFMATSLNNLAALYRVQGKAEQAEPLFQRALAIREQQLGPEHSTVFVHET